MNGEHESKVKELDIAYNQRKNDELKMQKEEIQRLRDQHEKSMHDIQAAMSSDVDSLAEKRQSIQQQNDSLQSFKMKTKGMEEEHRLKLDELERALQERVHEAQSKWDEEFQARKRENEQRLTEFVAMMESKK